MYCIQTRLRDRWTRMHFETYDTPDKAVLGLERMLDRMFFELNEHVDINSFRIVRTSHATKHLRSEQG